MRGHQSLSYTKWNCRCHIVFIPKRRRKQLFGQIRRHLGLVLHELAKQKGREVVEGHLMLGHVHMCLSMPKCAVSNVAGFIKGKGAISIVREFREKRTTSLAETFGRGVILSQRLAQMKKWYTSTSGSKSAKMNVTSS